MHSVASSEPSQAGRRVQRASVNLKNAIASGLSTPSKQSRQFRGPFRRQPKGNHRGATPSFYNPVFRTMTRQQWIQRLLLVSASLALLAAAALVVTLQRNAEVRQRAQTNQILEQLS